MAKHFAIVQINERQEIVNKSIVRLLFSTLAPGQYSVLINDANPRSLEGNAYYWSVVVEMVMDGLNHLGHEFFDKDTVHEFLKAKFNSVKVRNEKTGKVEQITQSTTKLNPGEFFQYIERIRRWSAEFLNVVIPDPEKQYA